MLGVVRVEADGRPVVLRGVMPRGVLAMLLLDANRAVSAERLAIGLWGEDTPPSSLATVQVHVSRLRKALGQPGRVETRREGYVLHIAADELDLARFDAAVEEGRAALTAGDARRASDLFTRALALCSGPPLAELLALPFAAAASAELDERRLGALELRIEADLAIGRHDELVPELQRLVSDHPLRERLHAQLMLALYRAGRQADALAQYRALHGLLSRELGVAPSPALRELQRAILEQNPALSPNGSVNVVNLPTPLSGLIGRTRERDELRALVASRRLVTLVGAGGSGKTRLALEVARELAPSFPDGVFWCSLAAVRDPELVLPEIAAAIGADAAPDEHIANTGPLLLMDNLEHLLAAAPQLARLLQQCPKLHLLATSRAPLRVDGEHEYEVEPLPDHDAVALFTERAVVAEPKDAVREICWRLDNLPLALELAAARTRILPPTQLVQRLERRLPLLTSGRRDAPERQRTLRATIEWSHDLLSPVEQEQFARAAVFAGSFDLHAAEIVSGITTDGLEALVEWSLVRQRNGRFSMLETIREYATERLELSAASTGLRARHASYFLDLAERAAAELETHGGEAWMTRLETEDANLRRALTRLIDTHAAEDALRLCIALETLWALKSRVEEGLRWFDAALALATAAARQWPAALRASGYLLVLADRADEAIERLRIGAELCRRRGDTAEFAATLRVLGTALGAALLAAESRAALEEALEIYSTLGDRRGQSRTLHTLGDTLRDAGNLADAAGLLERSIALGRGASSRIYVANATHSLADLELDRGNLDRAEELYRETLRTAVEFGIERHKLYSLAGLAAVAALRGNDARARLLWRGVEGAERELHTRIVADERQRYERIVGHVDDPDQAGRGLAHTVAIALRDLA